ncbi:MAG TPA: tetratricopeptide repeat protein [Tepidisphaeraceae bacterium]|nr:tetratricopeptide repeat protein [Tepidisphaeraceae bacterium]
MSAIIPRCERCNLDRVFVRVAPFGNAQTYGVEWRCPHCDDHLLDLCPVGPLVPTSQTCLNCGTQFSDTGDFAVCPSCALTRLGARDSFGLDAPPADPVAEAEKLFDLGLIRRGLATANFALIADPALEQAWRIKYSFLSGLGLSEPALTVIEAAIARVDDPELMISLGYTLQSLDRHAQAIDAYQAYVTRLPKGESAGIALCNMANSYRAMKDDATAEAFYRRAIEKDPGFPSHYANYGRLLYEQKRYDEAHPVIDKGWACSREPAMVQRLLLDKALLFAEQMRGAESLQCVDAAIEQGADGVRAYYLRGRALALLGRLNEARDAMQRVRKIDPKNADGVRGVKMIDEAMRK